MSEAGSEQGWGSPDISGTVASQEGKEKKRREFYNLLLSECGERGTGSVLFFFFFEHHIPVFFFSLENILMLVLSSLETKELNWTEEAKEAWGSLKEMDSEQLGVPFP